MRLNVWGRGAGGLVKIKMPTNISDSGKQVVSEPAEHRDGGQQEPC